MKVKVFGFLGVVFILFIFCGCPMDKRDLYQQIFLKTDHQNLYLFKSYVPYLQDSVLPVEFHYNSVDVVESDIFEVYNAFVINEKLKDYISKTPQKAIYFFLFDKNVIDTTLWNDIRDNRLYLKRFNVKEDEVNNTDDVFLYY
jgi:hypothetical protein